jgi:hypothetical protein
MWSSSNQLNPTPRLFERYQRCQADGKALVLNVGPDRAGRIPADQVAVLMEMKKLIAAGPARNTPAAQTNGTFMILAFREMGVDDIELAHKLGEMYVVIAPQRAALRFAAAAGGEGFAATTTFAQGNKLLASGQGLQYP